MYDVNFTMRQLSFRCRFKRELGKYFLLYYSLDKKEHCYLISVASVCDKPCLSDVMQIIERSAFQCKERLLNLWQPAKMFNILTTALEC